LPGLIFLMKKFFIYYYIILLFYISLLFSSEGLFDKNYKFFVGYKYNEYDVLLQSIDREEILVDINGKSYKYFDKTYKEFYTRLLSNKVLFSFEFKPFNKFWYLINLQFVPSQNVYLDDTQKLCSTETGWCGGVGINYSLFPQTIVSYGINIECKIFFEDYKFNYFLSNTNQYTIDTELLITNILTAISFSKIFYKFIEMNIGCEVLYRDSSLIDKSNLYIISGKEYIVQVSLLNRIYLTKNESISLNVLKSLNDNNLTFSSGIIIGW